MFEAFEMPATPSIIIWDKWTYANNQNGIRPLYYNRNKSDVSLGEIFRFNTCLVILTSITYWMPDFAILPDTFMKFRRLLWKEEASSQSTSLKDKKMAISFLSRKKKKVYYIRSWITIFGETLSKVQKCICKPTRVTQRSYLKEPTRTTKKSIYTQKQTNKQTHEQTNKKNNWERKEVFTW